MWSSLLTIFGILAISGALITPSNATSFESPDAIRAAVQTAADRQIVPAKDQTVQVEIGDVDARIHLASCPALAVDLPGTIAPLLSARVSCRAPFWTLYVPIRVHAWAPAVVAATSLTPGTKLTAEDLTVARLDILATNGAYLSDPRQAVGTILRASLRAGAPVLKPFLDQPVVVHRGDTVVLTLLDSTITIRTNAIAMEDGRIGDRITVQNPDSNKSVRVTVADSGAVELRFDQVREGY